MSLWKNFFRHLVALRRVFSIRDTPHARRAKKRNFVIVNGKEREIVGCTISCEKEKPFFESFLRIKILKFKRF